jgi:hypothetical protein
MAHVEDRRGHAIWYRNRKKTMLWQADFIGVLTMESGDRYWVRIYEQKTRDGSPCIGVKLQAKEDS